MRWLSLGLTTVLALALSACAIASVEQPDSGAIPDGPLQALGEEETGEIIKLGEGQSFRIGWRFAMYKSVRGWCGQLETEGIASAGCGDLLPTGPAEFGSVGHAGPADGPESVDGFVGADVAEVWIASPDGQRFPTVLMPLAPAGLPGQCLRRDRPGGCDGGIGRGPGR